MCTRTRSMVAHRLGHHLLRSRVGHPSKTVCHSAAYVKEPANDTGDGTGLSERTRHKDLFRVALSRDEHRRWQPRSAHDRSWGYEAMKRAQWASAGGGLEQIANARSMCATSALAASIYVLPFTVNMPQCTISVISHATRPCMHAWSLQGLHH